MNTIDDRCEPLLFPWADMEKVCKCPQSCPHSMDIF